MLWMACYCFLQRILFSPHNKHCSFYPKVGSYLKNLWLHVQWKEACAVWRRQTSSVKRGQNKSDATYTCNSLVSYPQKIYINSTCFKYFPVNLSILNSMKLWPNKERKESRKGCKFTIQFFKTSGESRKSVKGGIGTRQNNLYAILNSPPVMLFNLFVFVVVVVCFCFVFFLLFFLLFEGDMELYGDLRCCGVVNIFVRYCGDLKPYGVRFFWFKPTILGETKYIADLLRCCGLFIDSSYYKTRNIKNILYILVS